MSTFLSTSTASEIDLAILRRDFFDGFTLVLQDENGQPFNLNEVQVCASVWRRDSESSYTQISTINVEKQEPLNAGRVRFWLSSAQTATIWDAAYESQDNGQSFFPRVYFPEAASSLFWDVRIEKQEELAGLLSVNAGAFISETNHGLGSTDRVVFNGTSTSVINYNGTGARVYTNLANISYVAPYSFRIESLFGITNASIGGSVYRLRQDTVVTGAVVIGTTLSNCFP